MKYFSFLFVILFSFVQQGAFDTVLKNTSSEQLKKRLINFQKGGIERNVNKSINTEQLITNAKQYLNTPHKMGGTTKKGIDCSGLVMVTFQLQNIQLPHSAHEQARYGKVIPSFDLLQKGDMVFYFNSYTTKNLITHSGIYIGNGEFIHTSNSKGVVISQVNDPYYWGERFLFGTRL